LELVVTSDIVDHGRAEQYEIAAAALARLPFPVFPVFTCPGNHDFDALFRTALRPPDLFVPRVTQHGPWLFVWLHPVTLTTTTAGPHIVALCDVQRAIRPAMPTAYVPRMANPSKPM
jgi:hypothetical protein